MAESHTNDIDRNAQQLAAQIDPEQRVLNVAEHLPMFTEQIIEDLDNDCDVDQLKKQLLCLHHTLLSLSRLVKKTNLVRVSSVLCQQSEKAKSAQNHN